MNNTEEIIIEFCKAMYKINLPKKGSVTFIKVAKDHPLLSIHKKHRKNKSKKVNKKNQNKKFKGEDKKLVTFDEVINTNENSIIKRGIYDN